MKIQIIRKEEILTIIPILRKLNIKTPLELPKERVLEMAEITSYECVGLYIDGKLKGISGLWYATRHYVGKRLNQIMKF
jgi:diamine N-acetyltransferase